ncbi:hypothetical protein TNCT_699981 [Trichonephila clavata]|uniref:Uncharacterized protein n=1 Tax=Trichonephila clavata TaxID=2740835 RepID=A0A8X6FTT9_TRICU|nr:hypothetical protein TNCT_699981 [Trichonephila clavata]
MAPNSDEHREITAILKAQGEEFYTIPPLSDRPLKMVVKGSTSTEEIITDPLEQGVPVGKVVQLTQRKSKFPLPIFLVEIRKHKQHIIRIRRNFNLSVAKISLLIARKSCLSLRNKMLIYTLILRPVLTEACPIWGHAAYSNIKMLESAQNKIIRLITDVLGS